MGRRNKKSSEYMTWSEIQMARAARKNRKAYLQELEDEEDTRPLEDPRGDIFDADEDR